MLPTGLLTRWFAVTINHRISRNAVLNLLAERAPRSTICPSEVARKLTTNDAPEGAVDAWRAVMPAVHSVVDQLVADGIVRLSWKGKSLSERAGPYRIAQNPDR